MSERPMDEARAGDSVRRDPAWPPATGAGPASAAAGPTGASDPDRRAALPADDTPTVAWTRPTNAPVDDMAPPPTEPVGRRPGGSRLRWGIALLVTGLILVGGVAAIVLLSGSRATPSTIVGYAHPESVAYGEVRLDLPGDQRQQLGQFLSRFPGFADQSTLDTKLDDVLDRVVRAMTQDRQDWTTKIKPWFGGGMGFSVGALPPPDAPSNVRALAILNVTDEARARAWFDEVSADLARTTDEHAGQQLILFGEGDMRAAMAIPGGRVMLVGDETSVRAAIDSDGRSEFAASDEFEAALAALEGDSLGYLYLDLDQYVAWANELSVSQGVGPMPLADLTAELTPAWMIARVQARGDALAFETVSPHAELSAADENRIGALAGHAPPGTIALIDAHDYGATLREVVERLREEPEAAEIFAQVDQALSLVGGQSAILDWMGDVGFALAPDGDGLHGGLLITPTDAADAERLLTTLRGFIGLAGGAQGVTIRDEAHAGTTITIVDIGDAAGMMGPQAGLPIAPGEPVELAWAVTDEVVVIGAGPSFVRAVIDAGSGPSLADDARYRALLDRVGAENLASAYLDIAAVREWVEKLGATEPEAMADYERDVKPYLEPFDALVQATVRDGDLDRTTMIVTVR